MGIHRATESQRVKATAAGINAGSGRFWVQRQCAECGETWGFYRYPRQPRVEFNVCASCASRRWANEQRAVAHSPVAKSDAS